MPLLAKSDFTSDPLCALSENIAASKLAPAIAQAFGYDAFDLLPHDLAADILALHQATLASGPHQTALAAYFQQHLKPYYLMQAMLNYVEGAEWISTATGFRTAREMQTDKASMDVYAQILARHERLRDTARQRAVNRLHADGFLIGSISYKAREKARTQRYFNYIAPRRGKD